MVSNPQAPTTDDSSNRTVTVPLDDRSYPIRITSACICGKEGRAADVRFLTDAAADVTHWVLIVDEAVSKRWATPIAKALDSIGDAVRVDVIDIPSGETSKSVESIGGIWNQMLNLGTDRRSVVVAVGGGVVGDLAGFAAATFARGVRFVQVPTTLLAMVDSSVGGKTGINLPGAKNMVGAFWQPEAVWIDTDVLATLPDRTYRSGLGEVVKYGVIDDAKFFDWLVDNADALVRRDADALRYAIAASCESKARVVGADERETSGRRAILNYGHTFAHAIEATTGYGTWLHGEAVAIGMQMAARLAIRIGMCDADLLERQSDLLAACQLPISMDTADIEAMLTVMQRDKKVAHGKLRFILPSRIGHVDLVSDIDRNDVIASIEQTIGKA
ncbi:3-dehydroquinate synthase [Crateriforma conspicua]|uniref:3-dehydroquinate synthase n=1 Tax=Crateriforma conspicua TaxID=2527996 RepID=A0A5C6FWF9_9PLAN|nr:3-dehydroquinate synthase [Crateriforma conspicua]TWU66781.1 3-dehydroquinate synthase [Crateriforma conspicua]